MASAPALLRRLRPDNLGAFAELFTAAVLQAAATGEPLLDESLSSLASRDVARFHQLNQRLQVGKGGFPSWEVAETLGRNAYGCRSLACDDVRHDYAK